MAAPRFSAVIRQFSSSASRQKLVTAPIQIFGVEGRYAHALYSAASKEKQLDNVEKDFKSLQDLLKSSKPLEDYLLNPTLPKPEKAATITSILNANKCSKVTINFFTALTENGRLKKMKAVMNAYNRIMSAHRGEVQCVVTTAKELDAKNMKELEGALKGFLKQGETLHLTTQVDPSIIGGMVVNIGDKYVDMSTATKIKNYSNLIKQAI
ncbi:ATP synthase subunit O, mitochondrial-like [Tubulanus polymorphus]|uniref:ATP synthase subunit O, mitochondrial-like n=1 Tax=Tubulanus polymorphus TaxID=672921 RepID=UPI003DA400F4